MTAAGLRVALRIDAHERVGHGHAVRSRALLAALPVASVAVAGDGDALAKHFPEAELHPPEAFAALSSHADLVIVDHPDPEQAIGADGVLRVVIDDGGDVAHADLVVNGTGLVPRHAYPKLRPAALRLCGTAYTLLRPAFARARTGSSRTGVVIAAGSGRRAADWLGRLLDLPLDLPVDLPATPLDLPAGSSLIVSSSFPARPELAAAAARQGLSLHVDLPARSLAERLATCSVALVTGGMIVPEALVAGAAVIAFPNEPDLVDELGWLAAQRALVALSPSGEPGEARQALSELLEDASRRSALASSARDVFDGRGAARVAHAIQGELQMRGGAA